MNTFNQRFLTSILVTLIFFSLACVALAKSSRHLSSEIKNAIEVGDYIAFTLAIEGTKLEGRVNEEYFRRLVAKSTKNRQIKSSIDNNDYKAFQTASKGTKFEKKVNKQQFAQLVGKTQRKNAITKAIENGDYQSFVSVTAGTKLTDKIYSKEIFDKLVKSIRLAKTGDRVGAKEIYESIGLKPKYSKKLKAKKFISKKPLKAIIKSSIENNDYQAFQEAIKGTPWENKLDTKEKFELFVKAQYLSKSGEKAKAKTIFNELKLREKKQLRLNSKKEYENRINNIKKERKMIKKTKRNQEI